MEGLSNIIFGFWGHKLFRKQESRPKSKKNEKNETLVKIDTYSCLDLIERIIKGANPIGLPLLILWSQQRGLNQQPLDYKGAS